MKTYRIAIVGLGATGTVLAAALLRKDPNTILVAANGINQAVAYLEEAGVHKDSSRRHPSTANRQKLTF